MVRGETTDELARVDDVDGEFEAGGDRRRARRDDAPWAARLRRLATSSSCSASAIAPSSPVRPATFGRSLGRANQPAARTRSPAALRRRLLRLLQSLAHLVDGGHVSSGRSISAAWTATSTGDWYARYAHRAALIGAAASTARSSARCSSFSASSGSVVGSRLNGLSAIAATNPPSAVPMVGHAMSFTVSGGSVLSASMSNPNRGSPGALLDAEEPAGVVVGVRPVAALGLGDRQVESEERDVG